jgi:hypothetical protein
VAGPLNAAGQIFSDIWYGGRPADAGHDNRMREYVAAQTAALAPVRVAS